jgi:hypothetical protein
VSETRKVRTTFQPDVELEVGEAEYLDLQRQGLLVEPAKKKTAQQGAEQTEG